MCTDLPFYSELPIQYRKSIVIVSRRYTPSLYEKYTIFLSSKTEVCLGALQDTTGFIVNRLLVPYQMEAVRMYERG